MGGIATGSFTTVLSYAGYVSTGTSLVDLYNDYTPGNFYRAGVNLSREIFVRKASPVKASSWISSGVSNAAGAIPIE